jgi:two-component system sensor histidine kinase KdpD
VELLSLAAAWGAIAALTALHWRVLGVTNPTIVALSFLLVVVLVAALSTRRVAVATSLLAFGCFNYFFLPPVGALTIEDPQNWVALFTLLAVSMVASHLSAQARRRTEEAIAQRDELARLMEERTRLLNERREAEVVRRGAELKSALLASLSHDLRTPLTAVTVAARNLEAEWLTDEQRREQLAIVLDELARLNRLFHNIVELARIETQAVAAEPEWVEPVEIVDAAIRLVEPALAGRPLEIDEAQKMLVRVDPRLTSAALARLLENAGQYSPAGAPIAVRVDVADGDLRIAVRDRGPGIAPADLNRLFDRSYRGAEAACHAFGTGMGLAIARGLLAVGRGRVWAENHAGQGAVFTLAVPAESRPVGVETEGA